MVLNSNVAAQGDSTLGFYPLHIGDLWQFHYHYSSYVGGGPCSLLTHSSYHTEEVLGDTVLPTGLPYKIVASQIPFDQPLRYLRVDTPTANVYQYMDFPSPSEFLVDSLRATTGSWFIRQGLQVECVEVDTATVFGILTILKHFRVHYVPFGEDYTLTYGFGRTQNIKYQEDPCYFGTPDSLYSDLVFARIDSQEFGSLVSVGGRNNLFPSSAKLFQNYPNPFNPSTTIEFSLPRSEFVTLAIFNVLGERVATLVSQNISAGFHMLTWRARGFPSGIYFYRLQSKSFIATKKFVLLK